MASPASPANSTSSGTSDGLMALLDRELQALHSDHSDADDAIPDEDPETASDSEPAESGRQVKRRKVDADASIPVCPPHPGLMGGLCIRCGALVSEQEESAIPLKYLHMGLQVSAQEAERVRYTIHRQSLFWY